MRKLIILVSVVIILILATGFILRGINKQSAGNLKPTPTISNTNLKTFKSSSAMDFTVQIPQDYDIDEKLTHIDFRNKKDFIGVDRTDASGFNSLKDFLAYVDDKNKLKLTPTIKELKINGQPAITRMEVRGSIRYKMYYIHADNWVYVFSTKSESLDSDLDQIAQSFKYTP